MQHTDGERVNDLRIQNFLFSLEFQNELQLEQLLQ